MTDWKQVARVLGVETTDAALAPLAGLEATFAPLKKSLEPDTEPAAVFRPEGDFE